MATIELEDPAGDVVEEVAIVGDRDHGARKAFEELLEPLDRQCVEVIRRLVEEQHVGLRQQQTAERDAAALATRELRDVRIPRRQTQRIGCDFELAFDLPPTRRIDLRLQLALLFEQFRHLVIVESAPRSGH